MNNEKGRVVSVAWLEDLIRYANEVNSQLEKDYKVTIDLPSLSSFIGYASSADTIINYCKKVNF
jgi:hypothetical protein